MLKILIKIIIVIACAFLGIIMFDVFFLAGSVLSYATHNTFIDFDFILLTFDAIFIILPSWIIYYFSRSSLYCYSYAISFTTYTIYFVILSDNVFDKSGCSGFIECTNILISRNYLYPSIALIFILFLAIKFWFPRTKTRKNTYE